MPERHWTIDLTGTRPGHWVSGGLAVLAGIVTGHFAPQMVPVTMIIVPIAALIHHDQSDRKPLWKFRKDRA